MPPPAPIWGKPAAGDRRPPDSLLPLVPPAAPALALWEGGVSPTGDVRARESTLEIRLARSGLPLSELDVMAPARPLQRSVQLRYLEPVAHLARRPGEPKSPSAPSWHESWECMPQAPVPCRLRVPLPGRAPSILSLRFHDGDNPPLPDLDAAVWRRPRRSPVSSGRWCPRARRCA